MILSYFLNALMILAGYLLALEYLCLPDIRWNVYAARPALVRKDIAMFHDFRLGPATVLLISQHKCSVTIQATQRSNAMICS